MFPYFHRFRKKQSHVTIKALLETGLHDNFTLFMDNLGKGIRLTEFSQAATSTSGQRVQIQVASFLYRELPVRLAQRIVDLESLPVMRESKYVGEVFRRFPSSSNTFSGCFLV